uniref:Uncharacterized protein n=1 Tax=Globisporangium ultimum (strain ATCC 200006 / CBS 805.95 / DAOM BR144) TaxID=431595 RepID=K3WFF8_GLOUD
MDLRAAAAKFAHAQVTIALATRMDVYAVAERAVNDQIRIALAISAPIERKPPPQHTEESAEVLPLLQGQEASFEEPSIAPKQLLPVLEWMEVVETFASEVLSVALERVVDSYASSVLEIAPANDSAQQVEAEQIDEVVSVPPLAPSNKVVSRRQLIYQVAQATNAVILSVVMQHVVASREAASEIAASDSVIDDYKDDKQVPTDDAHSDAPEAVEAVKALPLRELDLAQKREADRDEPLRDLEPLGYVEKKSLGPAVGDRPLLCSRIAQSFVHDLLTAAAATVTQVATEVPPLSIERSILPTAVTMHESMHSVRGGRQNKSPNVHKRHLIRKDTAAPAIMRAPSPPAALRPMLSPSLPTLFPSPPKAAAPLDESGIVPVVSEPLGPTKVHIKRKKDEHRTTHHSPHSQHQKPPPVATEFSEGGEAGDKARNPEENNTPSKANFTKSPREESSAFHISIQTDSVASSAASPPMSSARQAQKIYRPRRNLIDAPTLRPKPHKHPRRHPHHIENAAIRYMRENAKGKRTKWSWCYCPRPKA